MKWQHFFLKHIPLPCNHSNNYQLATFFNHNSWLSCIRATTKNISLEFCLQMQTITYFHFSRSHILFYLIAINSLEAWNAKFKQSRDNILTNLTFSYESCIRIQNKKKQRLSSAYGLVAKIKIMIVCTMIKEWKYV